MGGLGVQIQSVAMGWQVYDLSRRAHLSVNYASFNVSLIGLITFAPLFFLALPAGVAADHYDRKRLMMLCYAGELAAVGDPGRGGDLPLRLRAAAAGRGAGLRRPRAPSYSPASTALGPMLVPRELLPRAIAWNSLAGQFASIFGPAIAGAADRALARRRPSPCAFGLYLAALVALARCGA